MLGKKPSNKEEWNLYLFKYNFIPRILNLFLCLKDIKEKARNMTSIIPGFWESVEGEPF